MGLTSADKSKVEFSTTLGEGRSISTPRVYGGEIELAEGESRLQVRPFIITLPSSYILEFKDNLNWTNPTIIYSNRTLRLSIPTSEFPGKNSQYYLVSTTAAIAGFTAPHTIGFVGDPVWNVSRRFIVQDAMDPLNNNTYTVVSNIGAVYIVEELVVTDPNPANATALVNDKFNCMQNCEVGCDNTSETICDPYTDVGLADYIKVEDGLERWVTVVCTIIDTDTYTLDLLYGLATDAGLAIPVPRENLALNQIIIGDIKISNYRLVMDHGTIDYSRREAETVAETQEIIGGSGEIVYRDIQNLSSGPVLDSMYVKRGLYNTGTGVGNPDESAQYIKFLNNATIPKLTPGKTCPRIVPGVGLVFVPLDRTGIDYGDYHSYRDELDKKGMFSRRLYSSSLSVSDFPDATHITFASDPGWPTGYRFAITVSTSNDSVFTVVSNVGAVYLVNEAVNVEAALPGTIATLLINKYIGIAGTEEPGSSTNSCVTDDWSVLLLADISCVLCDVTCDSACQSACQTCQAPGVCDCSYEYVGTIAPYRDWVPDPLNDPFRADTCEFCDNACDVSCEPALDTRIGTYTYSACPGGQVCVDVTYAACDTTCESPPPCESQLQNPCLTGCEISCECAIEFAGITCFSCDIGAEQPTCPAFNIPGTDCVSTCEHCEICESGDSINCHCACDSACENSCEISSQTSCSCETSECSDVICGTTCEISGDVLCVPVISCSVSAVSGGSRFINKTKDFRCTISPVSATTPTFVWSLPNGGGNIISGQGTSQVTIRWATHILHGVVVVTVSNSCSSINSSYDFGEVGMCEPGAIAVVSGIAQSLCCANGVTQTTSISVTVSGNVTNIEWQKMTESHVAVGPLVISNGKKTCAFTYTPTFGAYTDLPYFTIRVRCTDGCTTNAWQTIRVEVSPSVLPMVLAYIDCPTCYTTNSSDDTIWSVHAEIYGANIDWHFRYEWYRVNPSTGALVNLSKNVKDTTINVGCGNLSGVNVKVKAISCNGSTVLSSALHLTSKYPCKCATCDVTCEACDSGEGI